MKVANQRCPRLCRGYLLVGVVILKLVAGLLRMVLRQRRLWAELSRATSMPKLLVSGVVSAFEKRLKGKVLLTQFPRSVSIATLLISQIGKTSFAFKAAMTTHFVTVLPAHMTLPTLLMSRSYLRLCLLVRLFKNLLPRFLKPSKVRALVS